MEASDSRASTLTPRRRTLILLGGAGASLFIGSQPGGNQVDAQTVCLLNPEMTEGPYWVEEKLNRSDIREDPSDGTTKTGVLLNLTINVVTVGSSSCAALPGAYVDIWHCDAGGIYSDVSANNTVGKRFLRGYQISDDSGAVKFTTIYPGWYSGRTIHIHLRVRTYSGTTVTGVFTSQLHFDDTISDTVLSQSPYNTRGTRDTRNSNDMVYTGSATASRTLLTLTQTTAGYDASITVGVSLAATPSKPSISEGGVANAASYQAGVVPQGWISLFGQNLAATTRIVDTSDLVSGSLPTTLGGVSVSINSKAAFMHYISPTQINVQAPSDTSSGSVAVTVTNSGGTSDAQTATMQAILLGFFTSSNYVAAVRSDGTIITSSQPAKSGDVLQLYGTGFGPTDPAVAPGLVFTGAYALTNTVTVTIGDVAATVSFAGLVAAGLYQINLTVPALANGDHAVVAQIAGLSTQSGALLKIQS